VPPIRKTYFRQTPRHAASSSSLWRQHVALSRESTPSSKLPDAWLTLARALREVRSIEQKRLVDVFFFQSDPITPRFMLPSLLLSARFHTNLSPRANIGLTYVLMLHDFFVKVTALWCMFGYMFSQDEIENHRVSFTYLRLAWWLIKYQLIGPF